MSTEKNDPLEWLAFQYISEELTDEEVLAFEDQLAEDQDAREAVARAVELTQTVSAVSKIDECRVGQPINTSAIQKQARWWQRVALLATALAACFALVLIYQATRPSDGENGPRFGLNDRPISADLVSAWVSTGMEIESAGDEVFARANDDEDELPDAALADELNDVDVATPDWMVAAISARHKMMEDE